MKVRKSDARRMTWLPSVVGGMTYIAARQTGMDFLPAVFFLCGSSVIAYGVHGLVIRLRNDR